MAITFQEEDVVAHGQYDLRPELTGHAPGSVLASYDLRVVLPPEVEHVGPRVCETGGRIPRCEERHVDADGWCCIGVFPIWRVMSREREYMKFLNDPLRNFLLGQLAVDEGLEWPFGEYRHGSMGAIEAAAELLGCAPQLKAVKDTLRLLPVLRERGTSVAYRECPCGSRRLLARCCFVRLHGLSLATTVEDLACIGAEVERHSRKLKGMKPLLRKVAL